MRRLLLIASAGLLLLVLSLLAWRGLGATDRPSGAQLSPGAPPRAAGAPAARPIRRWAGLHLSLDAMPPGASTTASASFQGRVVSAQDGRGLPGAALDFSSGQGTSSTAADGAGAFRFDPPHPGRWWLAAATAPGHEPFAPEWGESPVQLEARAGEAVRGLVVTLRPLERYVGRVLGPGDLPVEGAEVVVLGGGQGPGSLVPPRPEFRSGPDGAFEFAAPEDAVLEVRRPGFAVGRVRLDVAARVSRRVTVRLLPLAGEEVHLAIEGTVVDAAGNPAEGAAVAATPRERPDAAPALARADAAGRFHLGGLARGAFLVSASRPGAAPALAEVDAGATGLQLRLVPGGRLAGSVRDRASGAPVALFTVVLAGHTTRVASFIDAGGRFGLDGLEPGEAQVTVLAPGHAPSPELRVRVPEPGSEPARLDVELGRGGRVTGRVVERSGGAPVGGARVELEGSPSSSGVPIRNETRTGADGTFALDAVAEGAVGLFAHADGYHARVLACPPVREGETVGPVILDLAAVEPGQEARIELAGIGAGLEKRGDVLRVTMIAPSGGAAEAGLAPGDEVRSIDGAPVASMGLAEAIPRIRGPEGSTVVLLVVRSGDATRTPVVMRVPRRLIRT